MCHLSNIDKGRNAFPRGKSLAKGIYAKKPDKKDTTFLKIMR